MPSLKSDADRNMAKRVRLPVGLGGTDNKNKLECGRLKGLDEFACRPLLDRNYFDAANMARMSSSYRFLSWIFAVINSS